MIICKACNRRTNVIDCRPSMDGTMKIRKRICYGCNAVSHTLEVEQTILKNLGMTIPKQRFNKYFVFKKEECSNV